MKTVSLIGRATKQYVYLSIVVLYLIVSTLYVATSFYQHSQTKKILAETIIDRSKQTLHSQLNSAASSFYNIILLSENSSCFLESLKTNNRDRLESVLNPVAKQLLESHKSSLALANANGEVVYAYGKWVEDLDLLYSDIKTGNYDHSINFRVTKNAVYFYSHHAIDSLGTLLVGINDVDFNLNVNHTHNSTLFTIIYPCYTNTSTEDFGAKSQGHLIRCVNNNGLERSIASAVDLSKGIEGKTVRHNDSLYFLSKLFDYQQNIPDNPVISSTYLAFNITNYHKDFINSIVLVNIIIIIILLLVVFIFSLTYKRIFRFVLDLQKNLEEKLVERNREIIDSNHELNLLFNSSSNGIRIIDRYFQITRVNDSFTRLSGFSRSEIESKKCYEVFPSTNCYTDNCPIERIKNGETRVSYKDIRFNSRGERKEFDYCAKPFLGKRNEFIGIIEDFKDITERSHLEENLSKTQKQYENFMNSMPLGVFIRDFEGNMHYQNSYLNKAFGRISSETLNINETMSTEQSLRYREEDKLINKLSNLQVEEQLTDNNGIKRTYVTHKFKFIGANNKPLIGGVLIDISKRKNAEHNLYVLSKAINNVPIGVLISTPEGIVELCNPVFAKIISCDPDDILGKPFPLFNNKDLNGAIHTSLIGERFLGEIVIQDLDSNRKYYHYSVAPVFNRHSKVAHLIFLFDDITKRKENEKELLKAKFIAEESEQLKTAFLSNLSHEIRTPLNAIQGFSAILSENIVSEEDKRDISQHLRKQSNDLLQIINDLIDISEIETHQFTINKSECFLNQLLNKTFREFNSSGSINRVKTYLKLGVVQESFSIFTDPSRLQQVIRCLLSNAFKFTSSGFVEFGYTFKNESTLLFYFIDTGVGLSEEEQKIIFDPFRQADGSTTRDFSGLGLGLAISKHVIERLGGEIWVNSTKGQGSTFFFTLPYIPVSSKFEEFVSMPATIEQVDWTSKTILLADDIDSNYLYIQTLLKPTGVKLIWAKNGHEAVEIVKANRKVDLVLMDIIMPEIDGFEATRRIKEIDNSIKIIGQTAYPSPDNEKVGDECGMDNFLSKPIAPNRMLEAINQYIN